jgi:hypothetical protein
MVLGLLGLMVAQPAYHIESIQTEPIEVHQERTLSYQGQYLDSNSEQIYDRYRNLASRYDKSFNMFLDLDRRYGIPP